MNKIYKYFELRLYFIISKIFKQHVKYNNLKNIFTKKNFDFDRSLEILNSFINNSNFKPNDIKMISNHYLLIAAISLKYLNIKNILEIGTFDGYCSSFLSYCFKDSKITTIDLNDNDNSFVKTYGRSSKSYLKEHLNIRDMNIKDKKNIDFIQENSIYFFEKNRSFDLIFIDGDHTEPTVIIDIINSLKSLNFNGLIILDDVVLRDRLIINKYESYASFDTLSRLKDIGLIKFTLFPKRSIFPYSTKIMAKYVAMIEKNL